MNCKSFLLSIIILFLSKKVISENNKLYIHLKFEFFYTQKSIIIDLSKFENKNFISFYDNTTKLFFKLNSLGSFGSIKMEAIDSVKHIKVIGKYSSGLDTLKEQAVMEDISGKVIFLVLKKFEPYQDSVWTYMSLNNEILYKEYFRNGMSFGDDSTSYYNME